MRTVKDFVKQMFNEGKTPEHTRAVAVCSRWNTRMDEVDMWLNKASKIRMKRKKKLRIKRKKVF